MKDRYHYENMLWAQGFQRVMGLDEVGRGCLCGPVVAAGVILKPGEKLDQRVADSKSIDKKTRELLAEEIKSKALFWTINECTSGEIDQMNILKASFSAMIKCTEADNARPDYLLVDGNRFIATVLPHSCIVKGDDYSVSIASASILAKVSRDNLMKMLHNEYPQFGWDKNVGYPTRQHFEALFKYGYTKYHRKSFSLRTTKEFSDTAS
jgi:ribonuclease HII